MLKRKMTKAEILIILLLTVLLIGLLYYQFVYKYVEQETARYDTGEIESQFIIQQSVAGSISGMEAEIEENKGNATGMVATYNNLAEEINTLNDIFGKAESFNFSFSQATGEGSAVRRNINASFVADSYNQAMDMLQKLHDNPYRCLIREVSVTPTGERETRNLNVGQVLVSFTVTFYETLYNAETTNGLVMEAEK